MRVRRYDNVIPKDIRDKVSLRYKKITKAINREFWNSESEINNSIFVGSYGRNTAISTSDIDILAVLPSAEFDRYNSLSGNAQSRLLQSVRNAIKVTYSNSDIRADGQIVKVNFSDSIQFEVLPAFKQWDGSYIYPNSNMGGNWLSTNPKAKQNAIREKNISSNGLLVATCRHIRYIRDNYFKSYTLSGIVIDSFVYHAIGGWHFTKQGEEKSASSMIYEEVLLDYYNDNSFNLQWSGLKAPGSYDDVSVAKSYECLGKVLRLMAE